MYRSTDDTDRLNLAALEGARVVLVLSDGSRLDDCEVVSAGRRRAKTIWVVAGEADLVIPLADVIGVMPTTTTRDRGRAA